MIKWFCKGKRGTIAKYRVFRCCHVGASLGLWERRVETWQRRRRGSNDLAKGALSFVSCVMEAGGLVVTASTMDTFVPKRRRKARFSQTEISTIVCEVLKNKSVLYSRQCTSATNERKRLVWEGIARKVNATGPRAPRSGEEIRKKWTYLRSEIKRKDATRTGKISVELTETERTVIEMLGDEEAENEDKCHLETKPLPQPQPTPQPQTAPQPLAAKTLPNLDEDCKVFEGATSVSRDDLNNLKEEPSSLDHDFGSRPASRETPDATAIKGEFVEEDPLLSVARRCARVHEDQVTLLREIHKQMRVDSQRTFAFQQELLNIQREILELKRAMFYRSAEKGIHSGSDDDL
ncbi:uncharacterized protein LOC143039542 [Oratosquilla oratoria]|uniref:uncharacterized protein LOC143039542 n=1 Tax=Oratosquilla oratoria TaxID=337810 RepID=UPI003F771A8D